MTDLPQATANLDTQRVIAEISPLLFGGFAEHMGRCIYGGLYDPESPHADERGFRRDVIDALRDMGLTLLRYPGGNFVSTYDWRAGVGPRAQRPRRLEPAWRSIESNQFGTCEFIHLCRMLGAEPMLAVNLATAPITEAAALLEYCNFPRGTANADLRVRHGFADPFAVKYWGLGNELDGPWQLGQTSAVDYATQAREAAKLLKRLDPSVRTIVCGSSGPWMNTFPEWDRAVLETCWEHADYISLHNYATNWENDTPSFLAYANEIESQIATVTRMVREVKQKLRSNHVVQLAFDEWNVWYKDRSGDGNWTEKPRLSEEIYNLEDALVVAQWLNVLLRRCDVVKIACVAQVVNVISPLLTSETGLLKQATWYPIAMFGRNAKGVSLDAIVAAPTYATKRFGESPLLDVSATYDAASSRGAVFLVHRGMTEPLSTRLTWQGARPRQVIEAIQITGRDPKAANSWESPSVVVPRAIEVPALSNGVIDMQLPPMSFTMLRLGWT